MRQTLGTALLLIALVCGLYGPALGYGFAYEDLNDPVRFLEPPSWVTMTDDWQHRIVTRWTFGVSSLISPVEPFGYHLVSILFHALNTVLLLLLARLVFGGVWWPFVGAAFFAVHPLQTEAVAYISARADLVMTTGVLLALLAAERERWGWMLVAAAATFFAKESGLVAAPLALLWACMRWKPVPLWLGALVMGGGLLGAIVLVGHYGVAGFDLVYTAQETAKVWRLLGAVLLPVGLSIDHAPIPQVWAFVGLVAMTWAACWAAWSSRPWAFGLLFVLIALAPRLLIPLVEGLHEHHFYLPMVAVAIAIVGTLQKGLDDGFSETSA